MGKSDFIFKSSLWLLCEKLHCRFVSVYGGQENVEMEVNSKNRNRETICEVFALFVNIQYHI